jgi:glyoxylase-like metal-dependent hydrolase (beta-lactamase superfamily II)
VNVMTSPTFLGWDLEGVVVRRIDEAVMPAWIGTVMFPEATRSLMAETPWLREGFIDEDGPKLTGHAFVIETNGTRVLVDTGVGNDRTRAVPEWVDMQTPFLHRLIAAGFPPESIDLVITTHLHPDHVGWNTRLVDGKWVPTFPNARYLLDRNEWDYWSNADSDEHTEQVLADSVRPIVEAGLYDLLELSSGGLDVADGIRLLPTPGHTPGHLAVELTGGNRSAVITGDAIHTPVQLVHPDMSSTLDTDPAEARVSRRRLLDTMAGTNTLLLGTHFPHPTGGRVEAHDEGFRLVTEPTSILPPA